MKKMLWISGGAFALLSGSAIAVLVWPVVFGASWGWALLAIVPASWVAAIVLGLLALWAALLFEDAWWSLHHSSFWWRGMDDRAKELARHGRPVGKNSEGDFQ